jgi:hypothetical protein
MVATTTVEAAAQEATVEAISAVEAALYLALQEELVVLHLLMLWPFLHSIFLAYQFLPLSSVVAVMGVKITASVGRVQEATTPAVLAALMVAVMSVATEEMLVLLKRAQERAGLATARRRAPRLLERQVS